MPPQPGIFPLPYPHKSRNANYNNDGSDMGGVAIAGPSSRTHSFSIMDDGKRGDFKKRKEIAGKLGKEMSDRRDDGRHFTESVSVLHSTSLQLATRPETHPLYNLRLLPLTIDEEKYGVECAQTAYDEERERVEEEWKRGRDRVRERLMEGIEERRRRAREEKEGEGTLGDATLEQSRPHITRKLRNKIGTSPPPTPLGVPAASSSATNGAALLGALPIATGPMLNPHSLSVDELPSPFPLPLTSTTIPSGNATTGATTGGGGGGGGRRRPKGTAHQSQGNGNLGKSISLLSVIKDVDVVSDLIEIRRGNKRRRVTAASLAKSM
ncbi:hypothetical protein BD779DRAFT_1612984 [Infundibulicybe gibba]|nr:hypothetical protein BD779DRAFT_1612984 [Infundibulicybe gibba]